VAVLVALSVDAVFLIAAPRFVVVLLLREYLLPTWGQKDGPPGGT
jgi:hypothetical protein